METVKKIASVSVDVSDIKLEPGQYVQVHFKDEHGVDTTVEIAILEHGTVSLHASKELVFKEWERQWRSGQT